MNPHTDLKDGFTLLYYANPSAGWDPRKCQGETIFYTGDDDPLYAIAPREGRIVLFEGNGNVCHRAGITIDECLLFFFFTF